jgi:hypothetical protein
MLACQKGIYLVRRPRHTKTHQDTPLLGVSKFFPKVLNVVFEKIMVRQSSSFPASLRSLAGCRHSGRMPHDAKTKASAAWREAHS